MAIVLTATEGSIVATAMPTIVADLGGFDLFSWAFATFLLTQAVSIPIYGRLADLYGRKPVFFAGTSLFLVASLLCGLASGMASFIIFRALQGVGAGAIQPVATTIVGDIYTPAERARVQGYLSGVFGIAAIFGPPLGAFLVDRKCDQRARAADGEGDDRRCAQAPRLEQDHHQRAGACGQQRRA